MLTYHCNFAFKFKCECCVFLCITHTHTVMFQCFACLFATLRTIKQLKVGDKFIMIFRLLVSCFWKLFFFQKRSKNTKCNESISLHV